MEGKMKETRNAKNWYCPNCSKVMGRVLYGELHTDNRVNTSGSDLVVACECGSHKVWFTTLSLDSIVKRLGREIGRSVAEAVAT
jgi:RNase P subunit RPR2